jgi:hypothetical protein
VLNDTRIIERKEISSSWKITKKKFDGKTAQCPERMPSNMSNYVLLYTYLLVLCKDDSVTFTIIFVCTLLIFSRLSYIQGPTTEKWTPWNSTICQIYSC